MPKFLHLLSLTLFCAYGAEATSYLNYGDKCGAKVAAKCDDQQNLACSTSNVCDCYSWKVYFDKDKRCVSTIDGRCDPPRTHKRTPLQWTYAECASGAYCGDQDTYNGVRLPTHVIQSIAEIRVRSSAPSLVCKCDRGKYSTDNITCIPVLGHGEKCDLEKSDKSLCDPSAELGCSKKSKTCTCKDTKTYYDKNLRKCAKPLGAKCTTPRDQCGQHAICTELLQYLSQKDGPLWENVCQCLPGYSLSSSGECLGTYNVPCSELEPCNSERFLTCINRVCRCAQGAHTHFNIIPGGDYNFTCMLQPEESCSTEDIAAGKSPACTTGSDCKKRKCVLRNKWEYDNRGMPRLTYGENCTDWRIELPCKNTVGLACINHGLCDCFDSKFSWNAKAKRCVAKEGDKCGHFNLADENSNVFFHQLIPHPVRNYPPAVDEPFYIDCDHGLSCIFQSQENASRCVKVK